MTTESAEYTWKVVGVFPTEDEPVEAFVYTTGLWEEHGQPELWCSCLGECGHRVSIEGAHFVLNRMARRILTDTLDIGGEHAEDFSSGATLRFTLWPAEEAEEARDRYQTYCAPPDAPVSKVSWRCCAGKEAP